MTIEDFIEKNKNYFDRYKAHADWNGYKVYDIWLKAHEGACVGYPHYALEKDGVVRQSTFEETLKIMESENYPDDE